MKWHIVHTRPRWEKKVHSSLIIKGIQSFCPINKVHRQWSDRIKLVEEPLFAGQLFVKICDEERMQVRMTAGVQNFQNADGKPSILREKDINSIRKFSESYYNIKLFKRSMNHGNGINIDSLTSFIDVAAGDDKIKVPRLIVESLGFVLFADLKHAIHPGSLDKTK
jgi:transcription antitermination factor NusG